MNQPSVHFSSVAQLCLTLCDPMNHSTSGFPSCTVEKNPPANAADTVQFIQFSSVSQSCLTLCDPMNRSTPGLPVHHQLPEFTQTHVHRVGDAIQPSLLCRPLLLLPPIPPSIRVFSNESTLRMKSTGVSALSSFFPKNTQD